MILATYDLTGKTWTVTGDPEIDFDVAFTDGDADPIEPDRLRFGWTVTVNGEITDEAVFPTENVKYVSIRPTARFHARIDAAPDDQVTITFAASTGDDDQVEDQIDFTIPRPPQPYPSWVWGDGYWQAPKPYPDDEAPYVWDEDEQDWIAYTPED